ncbi:ArgK/MeaB family GTPase [Acidiplasma aeolicum]|uniref:GTPase n=1 Tax=Acidiplasma aeolicum TaxID=507754 RepID=A0A0Q0RR24_9ARCH|nr:GTPase [Acidiplasma aeolicum]KQB34817.1 GTPase [Acidiplasma aeolicum]
MNINDIVNGILAGDKRMIARSISLIENDESAREAIIERIYSHGSAKIIGITGPPGVGKSTIIGNLAPMLAKTGKVSILAVDPASPFSGGSILGNRIRMQEALSRYNIYMRSTSNRLYEGGLSEYSWDIIKVMEASGSDYIIVETVGSGQSDLDIMNIADITCVILAPGLGDEIQAVKSGLMEIGNIFIVNKMDREDSYMAIKDIRETLNMSNKADIPVIGLNSLTLENYDRFVKYINDWEYQNKYRRNERKIKQIIMEKIYRIYSEYINNIDSADIENENPYYAAEKIMKNVAGQKFGYLEK